MGFFLAFLAVGRVERALYGNSPGRVHGLWSSAVQFPSLTFLLCKEGTAKVPTGVKETSNVYQALRCQVHVNQAPGTQPAPVPGAGHCRHGNQAPRTQEAPVPGTGYCRHGNQAPRTQPAPVPGTGYCCRQYQSQPPRTLASSSLRGKVRSPVRSLPTLSVTLKNQGGVSLAHSLRKQDLPNQCT